MSGRWVKWLIVALAIAAGSTRFAPQALAFPYAATIGDTRVYSEEPIAKARLAAILVKTGRLLNASSIYTTAYPKTLVLTQGSWRWLILAPGSQDAFAVSYPLSDGVVVNGADLATDSVSKGAAVGGRRSLSAVIAHERTHGLIRARFGPLADVRYPRWLREGYCDTIARESSLDDATAQALLVRKASLPALDYYLARRRVEHELRTASVDDLFARNRRF